MTAAQLPETAVVRISRGTSTLPGWKKSRP